MARRRARRWDGALGASLATDSGAGLQRDVMPDYSPYLQRIADALQQRPTPTWLVALVASVVGGLFAVGAQIAKAMFDEHRRRKLLSRMLHHELRKNFLTLYQPWELLSRNEQPITEAWVIELFQLSLDFSGRDVLRKAPEIYLLLPEHLVAEVFYVSFDRISHATPKDLDYHLKTALYLYSWNLLKDEKFKAQVIKAVGPASVDELLPKAQTCLDRIGVLPAIMAYLQPPPPQQA